MNIKTRFSIGDTLFTIDPKTMKMHQFKVGYISIYVDAEGKADISYRADDDTLFTEGSYDEDKCFATEAELLAFVTSK